MTGRRNNRLFCSDDFGDASAPPDWIEVDEDEAAPLLRPASPLVCDPASFEIVRPPCMLERHGWRKGVPIPTFQGEGRYRGGFSDHLPVAVRLNDGR